MSLRNSHWDVGDLLGSALGTIIHDWVVGKKTEKWEDLDCQKFSTEDVLHLTKHSFSVIYLTGIQMEGRFFFFFCDNFINQILSARGTQKIHVTLVSLIHKIVYTPSKKSNMLVVI